MKDTVLEQSKTFTREEIEILLPGGFEREYMRQCARCNTNERAYLETEKIYYAITSENKYASYESFRVVKNRKFKK